MSADGSDAVFTGLPDGEEYRFTACAESWFDGTSFGRSTATESVRAQQSGRTPSGWTFAVDATPNVSSSRAEWIIRDTPTSSERVPNRNHTEFAGWGPGTSVFDRSPGIQVRYVHNVWGTATPWAVVAPRAGSAPYQVQAQWSAQTLRRRIGPRHAGRLDGRAGRYRRSATAGLHFFDVAGVELPRTAGTWTVPVGAVRVDGVSVTVDWSAQGWGLAPVSTTFSATCDPNLPPVVKPPAPPAPQP